MKQEISINGAERKVYKENKKECGLKRNFWVVLGGNVVEVIETEAKGK